MRRDGICQRRHFSDQLQECLTVDFKHNKIGGRRYSCGPRDSLQKRDFAEERMSDQPAYNSVMARALDADIRRAFQYDEYSIINFALRDQYLARRNLNPFTRSGKNFDLRRVQYRERRNGY